MTIPDGPPPGLILHEKPLVPLPLQCRIPPEIENRVVNPLEVPSEPSSAKLTVRNQDPIRRIFSALRRGIRALQGDMSAQRRRHTCDQLLKAMSELEVLLLGRRSRRH
uniref:Rho-guanine nucleotide exchange factor n=1 Tax=Lygus hesperus TaxID=30085 RepID=A0A0A9XHE9_LYGHE